MDKIKLSLASAINLDHPNISYKQTEGTPKISFKKDRIYFNGPCCKLFGITPGTFIHFWDGKDKWWFTVGTNTGFKVASAGTDSHKGLTITSSTLLALFSSTVKVPLPATYYVVKSATVEFDGQPVAEFDITKSIESLLKQAR